MSTPTPPKPNTQKATQARPTPTTPEETRALAEPIAPPVVTDLPDSVTADLDQPAEPELTEYVVIQEAITYRTGKKPDEVSRFGLGARLRLWPDDERTIDLLRSKAITVRGDRERIRRPTALEIFRAIGADDDPAEPPVQSALPMVPVVGAPAL